MKPGCGAMVSETRRLEHRPIDARRGRAYLSDRFVCLTNLLGLHNVLIAMGVRLRFL
jgi:hypothetical protein